MLRFISNKGRLLRFVLRVCIIASSSEYVELKAFLINLDMLDSTSMPARDGFSPRVRDQSTR